MDKITVKTTVQADIDKVWDYWTQPEHITEWNYATDEWCCPKAENNLHPGGKFSSRMEAKDGSMGFDFEGRYDRIDDKELISYKMADGRAVKVEFIPNGGEIQIIETFDAEATNSNEQQRAGWQAILGNFKKYVERN